MKMRMVELVGWRRTNMSEAVLMWSFISQSVFTFVSLRTEAPQTTAAAKIYHRAVSALHPHKWG